MKTSKVSALCTSSNKCSASLLLVFASSLSLTAQVDKPEVEVTEKNLQKNYPVVAFVLLLLIIQIFSNSVFAQSCSSYTTWRSGMWIGPGSYCGSPYGGTTVTYNGRLYTHKGYCSKTGPGTWDFVDVGACSSCANGTVNAGSNLSVCQGATSGALGGSIGGGATGGTWKASSGTVNNATNVLNATYTANGATGNITLTLTATGGCSPVSQSKIITVYSNANNPGAISVPAAICKGTATNISNVTVATTGTPASSVPTYYYYWQNTAIGAWNMFLTTTASSATLPTAVTDNPGNYVVARNSAFACTGQANNATTVNIPIRVDATSTLGTKSTAGPVNFCDAGGNFTTAVTVSGQTGSVSWNWGSNNGAWNNWVAGNSSGVQVFPEKISDSDGRADRIRYNVTNGVCPAVTSSTILISNYHNVAPSSITSNINNVCPSTAGTLTATFPDAVNMRGRVEFATTLNGAAFAAITPSAGQTVFTTNVSPTTTTTYYVRYSGISGGGASCYSASQSVVVTITPLTSGTIGAAQTISGGGIPATLTETVAAVGGDGLYNYQWQSSTNGDTFANIAGATDPTYAAGALGFDTWYKRIITSGSNCGSETSNAIKITVNNPDGASASISLDGVNDYVEVLRHNNLYSGGSGTYSVWVYPETQVFAGEVPFLQIDKQCFLGFTGSTQKAKFKFYLNGAWQTVESPSALTLNKWSHVAGVYTGTSIKLFVNGSLQAELAVTGVPVVVSNNLFIGGNTAAATYYKGRIDELSIWSKAFTDKEVGENRWENGSASEGYLRAYFKCKNGVVLTNKVSTYHGLLTNINTSICWKPNYASVWNGSVSTDFTTPLNWDEGLVPDAVGSGSIEPNVNVVVPKSAQGSNALVVNETVQVNNIIFNKNSTVSITTSGVLKVNNDIFTYGTPLYNGMVNIAGVSPQNIYGQNNFYDLKITNNVYLQDDQKILGDLTLNTGILYINSKVLTVVSNATHSGEVFHNSGTIVGNVTMQRYLAYDASSIGWHYLSSPLKTATFQEINKSVKLVGLGKGPSDTPRPNLYVYNETYNNPDWLVGWRAPLSLTTAIEGMQGYILYQPSSVGLTMSMTGELQTGTVNRGLTYTASSKTAADGWNLIGNPYPSMLDWDLVTKPSTMDNAIYVYDSKNDRYASYVGGIGINGGVNKVATMQAFFVHAKSVTSLSFSNNARAVGNNSSYLRQMENSSEFIAKIALKTGGFSDETVVRFKAEATELFDSELDAYKLAGSGKQLFLNTKIGEEKASINSLPFPSNTKEIPLEISIDVAGNYTFEVSTVSQLQTGIKMFIKDNTSSTLTPINETGKYDFYADKGLDSTRFLLVFEQGSSIQTSVNTLEGKQKIYCIRNQLNVVGFALNSSIRIANSSGQELRFITKTTQEITQINVSDLANGIYIVTVQNDKAVFITKILIHD